MPSRFTTEPLSRHPRGRRLSDDVLRTLPALASLPLRCVPEVVHSRLLCEVLNRVLAAELRDGELEFLEQRFLAIEVTDLSTRFRITCSNARLRPASREAPELTLRGGAREFLLLATREEDPDSLFFQRRLHLDGDAELGLMVKNFLDALELDHTRLPAAAAPLAQLARRVAGRLAGAMRTP